MQLKVLKNINNNDNFYLWNIYVYLGVLNILFLMVDEEIYGVKKLFDFKISCFFLRVFGRFCRFFLSVFWEFDSDLKFGKCGWRDLELENTRKVVVFVFKGGFLEKSIFFRVQIFVLGIFLLCCGFFWGSFFGGRFGFFFRR